MWSRSQHVAVSWQMLAQLKRRLYLAIEPDSVSRHYTKLAELSIQQMLLSEDVDEPSSLLYVNQRFGNMPGYLYCSSQAFSTLKQNGLMYLYLN